MLLLYPSAILERMETELFPVVIMETEFLLS